MKFAPLVTIYLLLFLCFTVTHSNAQLCQGSLGDPVINITFGSGANPGPALNAATTNYNYWAQDCPNDGYYAVRNSTSNCFGNVWHTITQDHTGNANGYFMIVNATYAPSDFYVDTVKGLCPGTTYEFAAWITNLMLPTANGGNSLKPNITFTIEKPNGTILGSFNTGDIGMTTNTTWVQYGLFFTSPTGVTDVVLRMKNNGQGGVGNDLALDDITFRPCGPTITTGINGSAQSKDLCYGQGGQFVLSSTVSSGYNNPVLQWQQSTDGVTWAGIPGANTATYAVNVAANAPVGAYLYRLTVAEASNIALPQCRVASAVLTFNVNPIPVPGAANNSPKCAGSAITLSASSGVQFNWTGPNNYSASGATVTINSAPVTASGKYYLNVTSNKGCTNIDSTIVTVNPNPVASAGNDTTICSGDTITLNGQGGAAYLWQPASSLSNATVASPKAFPVDTTQYILIVTNQFQCTDNDTVNVNVLSSPTANAGPDKKIFAGQSVMLDGIATGGSYSIIWTPDYYITGITTATPTVAPLFDTTYTMHVVSNIGCGTASSSVFVRVYQKIVIPNAFSPNGDGINDYWNIDALQTYPNSQLTVFDRDGQPVFSSTGYNNPWSGTYKGKPIPVGTYYYIIDLKNGTQKLSGSVTILR